MSSIPRLATPTFVAGARDELAALDIYKKNNGNVINSIQDLARLHNVDLSQVLRGGSFLSSAMPIISGLTAKGNPMFNKDNLIARLAAGSGTIVGALRNASPSLTNSIAQYMPDTGTAFATLGGVVGRVSSSNLVDISSLGSVISGVTGNRQVYSVDDQDSTVGLLAGIVQEATRYGIPNSFGALMETIQNPMIIQKVSALVLPMIVGKGDIPGLKDISDRSYPGAPRTIYPEVLEDISGNYRIPLGCMASEYKDEFFEITETYSQVNPNWNTRGRQTTGGLSTVMDLTKLQTGSLDFSKIIEAGSQLSVIPDEKYYALAAVFSKTDVESELRAQFPYTVIGNASRTSTKALDPRRLVELEYLRANTTIS